MIFLNEVDDKKLKGVYKQVDESIRSDKKRKLNDWISINLRDFKLEDGNAYFDDNSDHFSKILTAKFPVIKKLKEFMDSGNIQLDEELARYLKNKYKQCFDKRAIVKLSGVTVCPYCNRNFINLSSNERLAGHVNNSQLDHFYPKSKYPLFSLSYYNLIPSCFGCNNAKNEEGLLISPYEENLSPENLLQFDWDKKEFKITPNKLNKSNFYGKYIDNIILVVGQNGSGKTTLLNTIGYYYRGSDSDTTKKTYHYALLYEKDKTFFVRDFNLLKGDRYFFELVKQNKSSHIYTASPTKEEKVFVDYVRVRDKSLSGSYGGVYGSVHVDYHDIGKLSKAYKYLKGKEIIQSALRFSFQLSQNEKKSTSSDITVELCHRIVHFIQNIEL